MKFHKAGLLAMMVVLLAVGAVRAWAGAEEETDTITGAKASDFIKERSYIGVIGTSANIDQWGDFNGTNFFTFAPVTTVSGGTTSVSFGEQDDIPSITRQFGFGVILGHREGPWAVEVSLWRSDHASTFTGPDPSSGSVTTLTNSASLSAINFDFKRYFFTNLPTQPFISLGISFPWLWVRQSSYILSPTPFVDDETISGIGLNLGVGGEIYLDNNFSIVGGLYQRWGEFDQINGASKIPLNQMTFNGNTANVGALAGDGLNIYIGTTFGVE